MFGKCFMPYSSPRFTVYLRILKVLRSSAVIKLVRFFPKIMCPPFLKILNIVLMLTINAGLKNNSTMWESIELENVRLLNVFSYIIEYFTGVKINSWGLTHPLRSLHF